MKQKLPGGVELDLLTRDELEEIVGNYIERLADGEVTIRSDGSGSTDSNGAADLVVVYTVPIGMEFALHRLIVDADGVDPGATPQAGYFTDVMRSGERMDFDTGGVPFVKTASRDAALRFRNGETVEIKLTKGPASKTIRAKIQGTLSPIAEPDGD